MCATRKGKKEEKQGVVIREKEVQPISSMLNALATACRYAQRVELVKENIHLRDTGLLANLKAKALNYWMSANEIIPRIAHEPLRKLADEISWQIVLRTSLDTEAVKELKDMIKPWADLENDIRQAQLELENYVSTIPNQP